MKQQYSFPAKQRGMGLISFLVLLILLGFSGYVGWKLAPIYVENFAVKSALRAIPNKNVVNASDTLGRVTNSVRNYMAKTFRVNNVTHVPLQNIRVYRSGSGFEVRVSYEVREHIVGNVDAVVSFDNMVQV